MSNYVTPLRSFYGDEVNSEMCTKDLIDFHFNNVHYHSKAYHSESKGEAYFKASELSDARMLSVLKMLYLRVAKRSDQTFTEVEGLVVRRFAAEWKRRILLLFGTACVSPSNSNIVLIDDTEHYWFVEKIRKYEKLRFTACDGLVYDTPTKVTPPKQGIANVNKLEWHFYVEIVVVSVFVPITLFPYDSDEDVVMLPEACDDKPCAKKARLSDV